MVSEEPISILEKKKKKKKKKKNHINFFPLTGWNNENLQIKYELWFDCWEFVKKKKKKKEHCHSSIGT